MQQAASLHDDDGTIGNRLVEVSNLSIALSFQKSNTVTMSNVGVPIKLLHEAEGMKVTCEMKNGEIYRGLLLSAEDTMNMSLSEVLRTARNGQITKLPNVYLRGSSIRFIALPEILKNAPVFQKVATMKRKMEQAQQERLQHHGQKRKRGD